MVFRIFPHSFLYADVYVVTYNIPYRSRNANRFLNGACYIVLALK